jgi:multidrug resistance efflux pump
MLQLAGVVEIQEVRLASKQGGRVKETRVVEGETVAEGDTLVVFEAPELEAQQKKSRAQLENILAELERAKNGPRPQEIAAARAALAAAEARWQRLKAGYREEEKRQAQSELAAAQADLKLAEEELGRADRLLREQTGTQAELDRARAAYDRARGRALSARAQFELLVNGSRPEDIAEAAALRDQAQANLQLLQAGTRPEEIAMIEARAEQTRAALQELDAQLAEAVVRAPGPAVVDVLSVRKGDVVAPGQTVVRVLRAADLWVKVYVPETELGKLRLGQSVQVSIDAYPGRRFAGKIRFIASQSEFTPRNVQSLDERRHQVFGVKVHVDDPQGMFKSGLAAEVFVPLAPAPPVSSSSPPSPSLPARTSRLDSGTCRATESAPRPRPEPRAKAA